MSEKEERLRGVLAGEAVDRVPFGFWTHFPGRDLEPDSLAEASAALIRDLDLDFAKSMPNGLFSVEDWGCGCDYGPVAAGGVARVTRYAIEGIEDWGRLEPLDVEKGALGRELRSLSRLIELLRGEVPLLATVFSPLTTALKLAGPRLAEHLRSDPDRVKAGLEVIAASTAAFAARAVAAGAAGIYLASQMSQRAALEARGYEEFGVPHDLRVLEAVRGGSWFDVVHLHGSDVTFEVARDYPVRGFSWHVWETAPTLEEFAASRPDACVVGGLRRFKISEGARHELLDDISGSIELTRGRRLLLAPGCVVRRPFDLDTLRYLRRTIASRRLIAS